MKHHTVKHAHSTQHSRAGGHVPGEHFHASTGAASGGSTGRVETPKHGHTMPEDMPVEDHAEGHRHITKGR
jgi:hypothetical protein